ncbi:type II toxin-antitoxin system PemK/MazF family toxin [Streptomyces cellulosae]|uniref:type II toxin-antitoxin system PemK/MazF family toxin n=1 Tax=Streptomyces sp. SID4956 TaxID=2690290 RepID=UPI001370C5E5|nr:type II toxin-antitoxin system PemK/MazF family toxin [Streptomyces sp. McG7]MYQ35715.1 type II toxin-antitoxin system PemK/MazF family toxin [Streptomyces sp. SID4956]UVT10885.1 type II toxin-antitoxin system PemK/MazF family toxin [Streptomyces thermocarboxydus]
MVTVGSPLRGEVWGCVLPTPIGPHPVVVLTVNRLAEPLSALTVAMITGTSGPAATHVPVGPDCGVTKYDESYVNCTDLHTVDKPRLRRRLGLLTPSELRSVEDRLRVILGLV